MSNFRPGPGQYDPTELERTILQEEIRRRAMHQGPFPQLGGRDGQPHPPPPPPTPGVAQSDYAQHISMLQRQQQQQQQQVPPGGYPTYVHSPYARNPYTGIADARAAAAAAVYQQQAAVGANGQLSQMYAHHERQRHQQQQQAAAAAAAAVGGYGAATYGPGVATPPAMDHHHHYAAAAYGLAAPPPITTYARDPAYPGAPNGGSPSPHDIALMQHQHHHPQHLHPSPPPPDSSLSNQANIRNSGGGSGSKQQLESSSAVGFSTPTGSNGGKPGTLSTETTPDKEDESPFDNGNLNDSSQRTTEDGMVDATVSATPVKSRQISPRSGSSGKKSISSSSSKEKTPTPTNKPRITVLDGTTVIEDGDQRWYTGCVPLGLDDDKYWLSELQVVLRAHFAEAFGATEDDIAAPMHGRNKPIALGQVGIRCMHCKHVNPSERGQQATSYPSLISGIYNSVQQMLRLHLDCCLSMPPDVRAKIEQLKSSCSSRGGRKQYWIDSAKRLGLVDTPHGIHFGRDPNGPLPPLTGPSVNSKEGRIKKKTPSKSPSPDKDGTFSSPLAADAISSEHLPLVSEGTPSPQQKQVLYENEDADQDEENENQCSQIEPSKSPPTPPPQPPADSRPLVFPEDKSLISDYLYLTLEQMAPCLLMEADRVGCYKTRKVGFPGLACKHCVGQAGCGRYFPASEASLSQTTTSQTIMNHVRNCRRCPIEIRENLEIMKRNRMGPDGKRADKPKHGGRKVFFHRLWCRIQELPLDENITDLKEDKKRKNKSPNQKKKQKSNDEDDDNDSELGSDDDNRSQKSTDNSSDAETESEDESENSGDESVTSKPKPRSPKSAVTSIVTAPSPKIIKKTGSNTWYAGCVRLTKADDPHWLTEMECFARSDLIEVFSYREGDPLDGYAGRRDPSDGQVGIRCVFCKALDPPDRINGCVTFPDSMSQIHARVTDMIRLHFPSCPSMPHGAIHTFKSYRGFDAKVANEDSAQYWVDAARDIGLANLSPMGPQPLGAWGIAFRRDPLQPSPADELDLEQSASNGNIPESAYCKNSLVRLEDRGFCTDQVMLLLRQVRPCRFQASDRRAGPGSRGRDRIMGFPGLCCMHCVGQNTLGRYFPVSAKNLTDSTTNSLQAHVASCAFCPEPIKASLAYLGHRSILQKAELSGSWKKAFFKKVWDRLHVEREWTSIEDEHTSATDAVMEENAEHSEAIHPGDSEYVPHDDEEEGAAKDEDGDGDADGDAGSDSEREDLGDNMNALIQAAAIWLTEQDNAEAKAGSRAKKTATTTTVAFGRNTVLPTAKRRRVHF